MQPMVDWRLAVPLYVSKRIQGYAAIQPSEDSPTKPWVVEQGRPSSVVGPPKAPEMLVKVMGLP